MTTRWDGAEGAPHSRLQRCLVFLALVAHGQGANCAHVSCLVAMTVNRNCSKVNYLMSYQYTKPSALELDVMADPAGS